MPNFVVNNYKPITKATDMYVKDAMNREKKVL
jgi:hypothetical protein